MSSRSMVLTEDYMPEEPFSYLWVPDLLSEYLEADGRWAIGDVGMLAMIGGAMFRYMFAKEPTRMFQQSKSENILLPTPHLFS